MTIVDIQVEYFPIKLNLFSQKAHCTEPSVIIAMPVFGARMVCEAGNYRQVQERHRAELEREIKLGK